MVDTVMNLELTAECEVEIENMIFRITGLSVCPDQLGQYILIPPNQGIILFTIDKVPNTLVSFYTAPVPTAVADAQAMLDDLGGRPLPTITNSYFTS